MYPSVVHTFHFVGGLSIVKILGLYFRAIRGCSVLTPEESQLGQILADWSMYNYAPMIKKELVFYCNLV